MNSTTKVISSPQLLAEYSVSEIALAAIAGMIFYGLVALAERVTTFWHPSYRT
jgi:ABC-type nitrate/sulfonate/bicarbonate transport system permease component